MESNTEHMAIFLGGFPYLYCCDDLDWYPFQSW